MAYIAGNRSATLSLGNRLAEIFSDLNTAFTKWRIYRRTYNELSTLSSRELDDLGLNHSTIRIAALQAAYGAAR